MWSSSSTAVDAGDQAPASRIGASDFEMEKPDQDKVLANPNILSMSIGVGPLSFCDQRQEFQKLAPPPKYFTDDQMVEGFTHKSDFDEIMRAFARLEDGGLIFTDQAALDR